MTIIPGCAATTDVRNAPLAMFDQNRALIDAFAPSGQVTDMLMSN